ncbi:MAG: sodium/proline symporter [Elusimicrobiota bacterium]|jgi:sodium/proline symporter|nr:sodium/proline symporter [Elusimicrobiota bacterium]
MSKASIEILIIMLLYMFSLIAIGVKYAKKANENSDNYFIGGRKLGPWLVALSAEASDMSGWLLMGLPGVAYWLGIADAAWTAIGLAAGTYINWLIVAKPLRKYSHIAGNSITIPDFFSNRFKEKTKVLLLLSSLFTLIFFAVYAGSCFVTGGKLFSYLFGFDYGLMMIIGAVFVIIYTLLGGFLSEATANFMQASVMIIALIFVLAAGVINAGGVGAVIENVRTIPGFLDFFAMASPTINAQKVQITDAIGLPIFGDAVKYGFITIISTMSWGLGYFGMPQVLVRFISIKEPSELGRSRRIATVWCVISLACAVLIGIVGRAVFPTVLSTASASENVFIHLSNILFHPIIAGIMMSGILAASFSSASSYLLIATSAVSKNIFQGIIKKDAPDKHVMRLSYVILLLVSLTGIIIAMDESSVIFSIVSFAWAGFGAAFGPLMLFSLFWRRATHKGAIAGLVTGGSMVFIWKLLIKPLGGVFGIYELLPSFVLSSLAIIIVSLLTKPNEEVQKEFDSVYVK